MATEATPTVKCLIVGAGPVGSLAALYAVRRGWNVQVYELRGDLRDESTTPLNFTRSINLALSERGIHAIRKSGADGLLDAVMADTVPMYGRMIHGQDSNGVLTERSQPYDTRGRSLKAIDRTALNKILLSELQKYPNVQVFFHHKLTGADFRKRRAWFEHRLPSDGDKRPQEIEIDFDIVLGCDGAHSSVRYHMMKFVRMSYEQTYINTLWCEFAIPAVSTTDSTQQPLSPTTSAPSAKDGFAASPNHLHIWPGKEHMFIAIPSTNKTFTCTLFAPAATFTHLEQHPESIETFFRTHFPGAANLIGADKIQSQFQQNPHLPLISVKCAPHVYSSSAVILGDAAHAMVPFYGQGMNAGLEDVRILFEHLDQHSNTSNTETEATTRAAALTSYTTHRVPDAHTINDLALGNYWEMRAGVQSPTYLLRKKIEEFLSDHVPATGFATQYSRVAFSNQRYSEVVRAVGRQRRALIRGLLGVGGVGLGVVVLLFIRLRSDSSKGRFGRLVQTLVEAIRGRR